MVVCANSLTVSAFVTTLGITLATAQKSVHTKTTRQTYLRVFVLGAFAILLSFPLLGAASLHRWQKAHLA